MNASVEAFDGDMEAVIGLDRVSLSGLNGAALVVDKAVVAGVEASGSVAMGLLGLNAGSEGVRDAAKTGQAGMLQEMKEQGRIPSLAWAYTAGAGYCELNMPHSLDGLFS